MKRKLIKIAFVIFFLFLLLAITLALNVRPILEKTIVYFFNKSSKDAQLGALKIKELHFSSGQLDLGHVTANIIFDHQKYTVNTEAFHLTNLFYKIKTDSDLKVLVEKMDVHSKDLNVFSSKSGFAVNTKDQITGEFYAPVVSYQKTNLQHVKT